MSQTTKPLILIADESSRLGYKYRLVVTGAWQLATARQEYQIKKPKRNQKGG